MAIRTRIVKIGNSQGVRIPKALLEQSGIFAEVEIEVQPDGLIIRPLQPARLGWEAAFATMSEQQDDRLLDAAPPTVWDQSEWSW